MVVAAKRKRNVADATAYLGEGHQLLDAAGAFNKVYSIVVVLFNTRGDCKYVRVKNDVLRVEAYFFDQDFESAVANFHFSCFGIGLAYFVESHYNNRSAKAAANDGLLNKFGFAFLH